LIVSPTAVVVFESRGFLLTSFPVE